MSSEIFKRELCVSLREVINRTNIFYKDKVQSEKFNFICAFMDRFDFAVSYLNKNKSKPRSEIDFMTYIMQASIVVDGIKHCYDLLNMEENKPNNFFSKYCLRDLGAECKDDDAFFRYFRSISIAHPLNTTWSIPNRLTDEIQYSPYCLLSLYSFKDDKNPIGVYIYSNRRETFSITFPFEILQQYLVYKYNLLNEIIISFNSIIDNMEREWKKRKVNRNQNEIKILNDVVEILNERYLEHYAIDTLIDCLSCELTVKENEKNVEKFRNKIKEIIPTICDYVDEYRSDDLYELCYSILDMRPKAHQMMHYQLEKIFCYLNDDGYGDVDWGLIQADAFSKEFAKKWVLIKPYDMSFKEIKLLVYVACYLEYQEQLMEGKNE